MYSDARNAEVMHSISCWINWYLIETYQYLLTHIPLANENMFNYENMIRYHSYRLFHILYRNHTKLSQTIRNSSDLIHYIVY